MNQVHAPTEGRETFLLPLKKGVIITPSVRIRRGADHMHIDGAIPSEQLLPQHFEAADQELCLRADAIGEVIKPIVREIEYGVAHGADFRVYRVNCFCRSRQLFLPVVARVN